MPELIIDNRPVRVAEGTKVITAAEQLGIVIPRFCFHPALGAVGACRMCAVKFAEGPVKGIQMSCMVDCRDGMVVSTTDAEAVDFRRQVIEWLMVNHPHDCPVCDEGGHCLLQDMTMAGGHGRRRYAGPKRTHRDQQLGPLLAHEMNRCIQCYRCTRFYQEFCGYRDLGVTGIGARVYFGRRMDGTLENPFSGNLVDICPTGVFTDKPSRYTGRRWDYQRSPGVCLSCSLGCNTVVSARYRRVVRQEARLNPRINGHFICDRGRHAYVYAAAGDRPRHAATDGFRCTPAAAINDARRRLVEVESRSGARSVAVWASPRCSLETLEQVWRLSRQRGWHAPAMFQTTRLQRSVQAAVAGRHPETAVTLSGLAEADFILCLGADPLAEGPMAALTLRQAWRRGARVVCLDPRPLELPFEFEHLAVAPDDLAAALGRLMPSAAELSARRNAVGESAWSADDGIRDRLDAVVEELQGASRPVVVCGGDMPDASAIEACARLALNLAQSGKVAGFFPLLPGPNAAAVARQSGPAVGGDQLVDEIEAGRIRALVVVESDPLAGFVDRPRLEKALAKLDLLLVMDYLDNDTAAAGVKTATKAVAKTSAAAGAATGAGYIFLPTATVYESGGTFINNQGLAQVMPAALVGGEPVVLTGRGDHPPRTYDDGLPGGNPDPADRLLADLMSGAPSGEGLAGNMQSSALTAPDAPAETSPPAAPPEISSKMTVVTVETQFGSEALSRRSPQLQALEGPARLTVSRVDADRLELADGDGLRIETGVGVIQGEVAVSARSAPGCILMPRRYGVDWQHLSELVVAVDVGRIGKVGP